MWFYSAAVEVTHSHVRLACFDCARQFNSLPSLPLCGKDDVSIIVPLFFSVMVAGSCHSQRGHGYPTHSALLLVAPPSFQAPSTSSSIVA